MSKLQEISVLALEALGGEMDQALALERILKICTGELNFQSAKKNAFGIREKVKNMATIEEFDMKHYKAKYGYFEGYPKFQLALDFFQMSNDLFFEKYKFNFVPKGSLYNEVKKLLDNRLNLIMAKQIMSPLVSDNFETSVNLNLGMDHTMWPGLSLMRKGTE